MRAAMFVTKIVSALEDSSLGSIKKKKKVPFPVSKSGRFFSHSLQLHLVVVVFLFFFLSKIHINVFISFVLCVIHIYYVPTRRWKTYHRSPEGIS